MGAKKHYFFRSFITLLLFFLISNCSTFFQSIETKELIANPPQKILDTFKKRHPNQKAVFYKINENLFEVEFHKHSKRYAESYSVEGQVIETEETLNFKEIDPKIYNLILSDLFDKYKSKKIFQIEKVNQQGKDYFEISVYTNKSSSGLFDVLYDTNGKWISETILKTKQIETLN